ncbi:acyl-CoA-binding protein [Caballeronia sp. J97]|uniref:acyl-CoA-binding protein n=1 Tax=Caballeronia sp. J97 TaxID=2805429 RepID=UPI002AB116B5|nr:acyl-CoA-binding protein [Caballeronia sp. J97]
MTAPRTAALLIHGLGGTQFDLGSMHKTLRRAGIDTHTLTLPGHGRTPEDLVDVRAEHWLEAVRSKYREVMEQYEVVHVIGMCMGSLLALALCAQERHERGRLVALAPPIYIDGWATPWYSRARHLLYWIPLLPKRMRVDEDEPFGIKNALVRSIVKAKFARGDNFHYRWVPLACIREVDRLRRIVKRAASALRCETLVLHAREDELTSLKSAYFLHERVERSEVIVLENSYHLICVDNDREVVAKSVLRFLDLTADSAAEPATVQDVPMSESDMRDLVERYLSAMAAQRFEAALPLFASDVVWEQRGEGALARTFEGRSGLVELFSSLIERSDGSFAFRSFGEPAFDGQTAVVEARYIASRGGRAFEGRARQTFVLRNGRIARVVHAPHDVTADAAFWASEVEWARDPLRSGSTDEVMSEELAALRGDALERRFSSAQASVKTLASRPSRETQLKLYAYFKQATQGDAPVGRPSAIDPVARAKHAAWAQLAGMAANEARRHYVLIAQRLSAECVA